MKHDPIPAKDAPKTRRALAKAERRQSLIDATIRSIAEFGLSGTTMARVAELAGASIGLASFYFDTKEKLLEEVLRYLADAEEALWNTGYPDPARTPVQQLVALVDARFHPQSCDRSKLAVWFAFWGDAGARDIYRRVVGEADEKRLEATVAIIGGLGPAAGPDAARPTALETALGLEAFYDGLWLNHLLYPSDFKRELCRALAIEHLAALFPEQFSGAQLPFEPKAGSATPESAGQ